MITQRAFEGDIEVLYNPEMINSLTSVEKLCRRSSSFVSSVYFGDAERGSLCCDRDEDTDELRC